MPTCMSCGSFYSRDGTDEATNFGELSRAVSEFEEIPAFLNLDWPSTVEFSSLDEVQDANPKFSATSIHDEPSSAIEVVKTVDPGAASQRKEKSPDDRSARKKSLVYNSLTGVDEMPMATET
ncbi:hypothetical protein SLS64_010105 [Diaporthe eres]|uniref:Uncharacterized protein n=1 Tax=Diaporthe eres TaxID=83184 RepID=A0ABR1P7L3_DIAER